MGYFPNGTSGELYEDRYCSKCLNWRDGMCAVWEAHLFHNYEECNNPGSILHVLIPKSKDGCGNEQCKMFLPLVDENKQLHSLNDARKYLEAFGFTVAKKGSEVAA